MASEKTVIQGKLPDLKARPCCLLVQSPYGIFSLLFPDHILDLESDLTHKSGTTGFGWFFRKEASGLIYTCLGGFIDLGHLRDFADLTRLYYYLLLKQPKENGVIKEGSVFPVLPTHGGFDGVVIVKKDIPATKDDLDLLINIARSLAYDVSIFYEISTYPVISFFEPGKHASAFSPEDLVSNFLGTHVADQAIRKEIEGGSQVNTGVFDTEVTKVLRSLLEKLQAREKSVTIQALDGIADRWIRSGVIIPGLDTLHLQRRNFEYKVITPWLVSEIDSCGSLPFNFPSDIERQLLDDIRSFYTAHFNFGHELLGGGSVHDSDNFDSLIAKIKADAEDRYGPEFDQI